MAAGAEQSLTERRPIVMVVDDEEPIRQLLRPWLTARGYSVQEAATGKEALDRAPVGHPDVILLDLGLPDLDGIEVARRLRQGLDTPIIILSVRNSASDKVSALEAGADDYLTKPWSPADLLERIRAALIRAQGREMTVFATGDLKVDLSRHAVHLSDNPVELLPGEYELLRVLAGNPGRLMTQQRLAQEIWGRAASEDTLRLLRATVNSLRRKLEINPACPRYLATEPGVGYRLRVGL